MLQFKAFGVEVKIDFLFVALVTIFMLTDQTGISVIALLCCFIHELGHLIMFFLVGYTPKALIFELMGIRLVKPQQELSFFKEALVQLAGSSSNFLVFFLLLNTLGSVSYISLFAVTHLLLGIFNLLPLKSLDGGKLASLFFHRFFRDAAAERLIELLDMITTIGLLLLSVFLYITDRQSMTLMVFSGGLFISVLAKLPRPRWFLQKKTDR